MFTLKSTVPKTELEIATDKVLTEMKSFSAEEDEYAKMTKQLQLLYALRKQETPEPLNINTLLLVIGNLAGIALVVGYERTNIVTSKALAFVLKTR